MFLVSCTQHVVDHGSEQSNIHCVTVRNCGHYGAAVEATLSGSCPHHANKRRKVTLGCMWQDLACTRIFERLLDVHSEADDLGALSFFGVPSHLDSHWKLVLA